MRCSSPQRYRRTGGPRRSGFVTIHAILPQIKRTVPGRTAMARRRKLRSVFAAIGTLGCGMVAPALVRAQNTVAIDADDIGGVVTGPSGPEAGVWVIAETSDLPTRFARTVVTDDQGRYVVPDLPKANYSVWVRGYGLVDSAKVQSAPGRNLNLTGVAAPDAKAAAQYYPGNYWYSLMRVPDTSEFPC